jgi:import inner membrane translocase subunit TIM8
MYVSLSHLRGTISWHANTHAAVHGLAETCWKKCVTGTIRGGKLDKSEESCAANCVDRFLDTSVTVIKQLEAMRQQ